tara:strand:- start:5858 stop:6568 length:711 start_codon:yes stop_codon:yes gene_type:complete
MGQLLIDIFAFGILFLSLYCLWISIKEIDTITEKIKNYSYGYNTYRHVGSAGRKGRAYGFGCIRGCSRNNDKIQINILDILNFSIGRKKILIDKIKVHFLILYKEVSWKVKRDIRDISHNTYKKCLYRKYGIFTYFIKNIWNIETSIKCSFFLMKSLSVKYISQQKYNFTILFEEIYYGLLTTIFFMKKFIMLFHASVIYFFYRLRQRYQNKISVADGISFVEEVSALNDKLKKQK